MRAAAGVVMALSLVGGFLSAIALMYTFTIGHHHLWVGAVGIVAMLLFIALFRSSDRRFGAGRTGRIQQRPRLGRADEMRRRD
jgi:hypothetical protein